mgnify:CR=1 FL=1
MELSKKTKKIVIFLLILNLLLGGVWWLISKKIDNNITKISDLEIELDHQLIREKQLNSAKRITLDTSVERNQLDQYFISPDGIVSFIKEIENLASIASVSIEIKSVGVKEYFIKEKESDVLELLNIDLDTVGNWAGNFYFLNLLESMPNELFIDKLSFNTSDGEDGFKNWNGKINIKVLKLK